MLNIIERLNRAKFSPAVAVLKKGGEIDKEVETLGIPFIEAPFTIHPLPYVTLPYRALQTARAFRPYRFALWHSFHYSDDYTEAIIARVAGAKAWVYTKKNMGWGSRAWKLRSLFATRIVAQNTDMCQQFFDNVVFRRKIQFIQRGVDTKKFHPGVSPDLNLRQTHTIPTKNLLISVVAHLVPVKGHATLLEALARVPGIHLLVAGKPLDQVYSDSLKKMTHNLGIAFRVHFLGEVSYVPALLSETDIFVLPTLGRWRMEGCPVALLEAMACGKACIATGIPGARDLIVHQESGWLVHPENPQEMAEALSLLSENADLRARLGAAARKRVENHYAIEQEVAKHEALYSELLE